MLRASLGKVVHTVQRAGTFAAKVSPQELHKIAVHVRAVVINKWGDRLVGEGGGEGVTLQTDAAQLYLFVPIPAKAKKAWSSFNL